MAIETVLNFRAAIGESPTWVADERALYWIDVKAPALHRYCPDDEATRSWPMTSDIGGFALTGDGGAVVALRQGLFRLDLNSGALRLLAPPPFDPSLFRFNEGACDANGRFWIGVMFDPLKGSASEQPGRLHSFTFAEGLREEPDAAELHNGMAWSGDGKTFFLSHSNSGEIFAFDYEENGGASRTAVFSRLCPPNSASPTAPRSTRRAVIGLRSMAAASFAAFTPTAPSIATSTYPSASRQCPPSRARTSPRSTSPARRIA